MGRAVVLVKFTLFMYMRTSTHKCKWCNKKYTARGKLKIHVKNHHADKMADFISDANTCNKCGVTFTNSTELGGHIVWCKITKTQKFRQLRGLVHGTKVTDATKEKLSLARSKYLEEVGGGGFTTVKWYHVKNILNEEYILRGTWEVTVAEWLNNNGILWKRKVYLPYVRENKRRTYTPDFFIPSLNLYLEVKGYFSQLDREKLELVRNQNDINLQVLLSNEIKLINSGKLPAHILSAL